MAGKYSILAVLSMVCWVVCHLYSNKQGSGGKPGSGLSYRQDTVNYCSDGEEGIEPPEEELLSKDGDNNFFISQTNTVNEANGNAKLSCADVSFQNNGDAIDNVFYSDDTSDTGSGLRTEASLQPVPSGANFWTFAYDNDQVTALIVSKKDVYFLVRYCYKSDPNKEDYQVLAPNDTETEPIDFMPDIPEKFQASFYTLDNPNGCPH